MNYPIILSGHDALVKAVHDRTEYINKWLDHVNADPETQSIVQLPIPGYPLSSLYVLVEKTMVGADGTIDSGVLPLCPQLRIDQSFAEAGCLHKYAKPHLISRN